jgi:HEAT repeat protein
MDAAATIQGLLAGFNDHREGMRSFAINKCAQLGEDAAPHLVELLKEKDGYVADSAARALQTIGAPVIPYLLKAMEGGNRQTIWMSASILSALGPEARDAVDRERPISARMSSIN